MTEMERLKQKIADLDRRLSALENTQHNQLWGKAASLKENLACRYGERVDKTTAAEILGVTRATVYAMLSDGRIQGACNGKKVSVESIAQYLAAPKTPSPTKKGGVQA